MRLVPQDVFEVYVSGPADWLEVAAVVVVVGLFWLVSWLRGRQLQRDTTQK